MIDRIQWLGHGSFVIQGPPLIYINPWRVARSVFHADIILISDNDFQHCSPADIDKLRGPDTHVIGSHHVTQDVPDCTVLRPWQSLTMDRASIKAVPAYSPADRQHPADASGLGFVISLNLYDIYYAGNTCTVPEMHRMQPDIAILPIDGRGNLNVDDAIAVVKAMRPRWVIPSHWGFLGSATQFDAQTLRDATRDIAEVLIPEAHR
jgi:L-ascorbate metabolism protein UlaG (beta-lactamase superfamily)